jgi:hypothetical protein
MFDATELTKQARARFLLLTGALEDSGEEQHGEEGAMALQKQLDEARAAVLYARAEGENIRRRAAEDVQKASRFAVEKFASSLLSVKDSLEAAGNAGHDADPATNRLLAPADAFDVISCGAVDANGVIAGFSSDGPSADGRVKPELLARGVATVSIHSNNPTGYQALNGTSLSTPIVAGAVALVKQARPELGVAALRNLLFTNAGDWLANGAADPLHVRGYGQVSAFGTATSGRLPEDINLDGTVGAVDLARVLSAWGACVQPDPVLGVCPEDLDGDGQIGAPDLARILSAWGG